MNEVYSRIKDICLNTNDNDPIRIARKIMHDDLIKMHGPEHHFIDGASLLCAIYNVKKDFDLEMALNNLALRSEKMPGAICGYWGICGAVASVSSAMSILHHTTPLTSDDYYKDHMELSSLIFKKMSEIGGPRCCKRHAYLALETAIDHVKDK
ncbi:MAG: DUF5714 domain-containing protein, partial [Firmicutes bacterium]|nr:DUF5714 domain-containing protein [Bacillota bacterium]